MNFIFYRNRSVSKIPSGLLGIFSLGLIVVSMSEPKLLPRTPRQIISPPQMIERLSFGYAEVIADIMWIRAVQDFDYCDQPISKHLCRNNSWLYLMLDSITNLSPKFRTPYAAGGLALTVIISDVDGATRLFEKAIKAFPQDWPILYRAAYHFLYELNDRKRAAELLVQAARNGAPPFTLALAGRLYSDSGHVELAENLLQEMISENQDPTLIQRLKDKIQQIKTENH